VTIARGAVSYEPHTLDSGAEFRVDGARQGFQSQSDALGAQKTRRRSGSFDDHFSHASLFWNSQSPMEKDHITAAFQLELWKVEVPAIRQRVVDNLAHVDSRLARKVAEPLGIAPPDAKAAAGRSGFRSERAKLPLESSPSLSMGNGNGTHIATRRIAVLVAPGVEVGALRALQQALHEADASCRLLAEHAGSVATASGQQLAVDHSFHAQPSVLFDALIVPGGSQSIATLAACGAAMRFLLEAYRHCKPICLVGEAVQLLRSIGIEDAEAAAQIPGLVVGRNEPPARAALAQDFIAALARHRHWGRPGADIATA
jgi:catalase